jgi:hypothetical protein
MPSPLLQETVRSHTPETLSNYSVQDYLSSRWDNGRGDNGWFVTPENDDLQGYFFAEDSELPPGP